ncbi:hypothetical protein [Pediococcus damnosus]|nr:hypothetical protein [Pediococcus damnosus]
MPRPTSIKPKNALYQRAYGMNTDELEVIFTRNVFQLVNTL